MKYTLKTDNEVKEYEVSYSQELQEQQLKASEKQLQATQMLFYAIVTQIVLFISMCVYAYLLVQKIDSLNPINLLSKCVGV